MAEPLAGQALGGEAESSKTGEPVVTRRAARVAQAAQSERVVPASGSEKRPEKRPSVIGRIGSILLKSVSWIVLIVCGALIIGFVLVPRLTGSTPYTVLTGSMRPTMPPGTTVVVKPIDFADITVGDVITYQIRSGEPDVVTHRVIGVNVTPDGVRLETQGDANPIADQELVREEQVRGKAWYWLPVIGYVTNGVTSDTRTWLAQGLGVGLIGYAVVTLVVVAVRGKKRGKNVESYAAGTTSEDVLGADATPEDAAPAEDDSSATSPPENAHS